MKSFESKYNMEWDRSNKNECICCCWILTLISNILPKNFSMITRNRKLSISYKRLYYVKALYLFDDFIIHIKSRESSMVTYSIAFTNNIRKWNFFRFISQFLSFVMIMFRYLKTQICTQTLRQKKPPTMVNLIERLYE